MTPKESTPSISYNEASQEAKDLVLEMANIIRPEQAYACAQKHIIAAYARGVMDMTNAYWNGSKLE